MINNVNLNSRGGYDVWKEAFVLYETLLGKGR